VARLAGLPEGLLDRARDVLHSLENMEGTALGKIGLKKEAVPQLGLFDYPHREILEELKQVQPEIMSPLEALEFLFKIKDKISKS
jgi:DNA mismatch repair protein MutS